MGYNMAVHALFNKTERIPDSPLCRHLALPSCLAVSSSFHVWRWTTWLQNSFLAWNHAGEEYRAMLRHLSNCEPRYLMMPSVYTRMYCVCECVLFFSLSSLTILIVYHFSTLPKQHGALLTNNGSSSWIKANRRVFRLQLATSSRVHQ